MTAVHGFVGSPQHHQFFKARRSLAFFLAAQIAKTGAVPAGSAKGGKAPKTRISRVFALSALSVLCFCEERLSQDPVYSCGSSGTRMNGNLGGEGDNHARPIGRDGCRSTGHPA